MDLNCQETALVSGWPQLFLVGQCQEPTLPQSQDAARPCTTCLTHQNDPHQTRKNAENAKTVDHSPEESRDNEEAR